MHLLDANCNAANNDDHETPASIAECSNVGEQLSAEMAIIYAMEARHAAQHGHLSSLKKLLDAGLVTPNAVDSDDCSLLHWAAINNRLDIAKLLIERNCNVNAVGGVLASTPLHWAARHGHTQMVALLVRHGANLDKKDVEGFTPLHIATQFGCTPVAAFFLASGQTSDALDDAGMTPAMWAAYRIHGIFPLHMLAGMGADLERHDVTHGNTALHWAVLQANHSAINTLIRLGVGLQPTNKEKETPLDIARRRNDLLAIHLLEAALRERGLVPYTCRQRLSEDKKLARNVLLFLPFFVIFSVAFIFDFTLDYFSKAELLIVIAVFSAVTVRYFVREQRELAVQNLLMGVAVACKTFLIVSWITFIHPIVPLYMQIAFLVFMISVPYTFYRVCDSDPGFIKISHKERCKAIVEMTSESKFDENFCSTCLVLKPHRARHCRVCGHCVLQHDHHCPWVSTCVGVSNYRLFVGYLLLLNLSTILSFVGCFYYWRDVCGALTRENFLFCRPWVLVLQWISFTFFVWTSMMSFIHCYELLMRFLYNRISSSHRCFQFNFGGNKLNMRSPFSRRCLRMRRICTLGCAPLSFDKEDDDDDGTVPFRSATPSSVRVTRPNDSSSKSQEKIRLL